MDMKMKVRLGEAGDELRELLLKILSLVSAVKFTGTCLSRTGLGPVLTALGERGITLVQLTISKSQPKHR